MRMAAVALVTDQVHLPLGSSGDLTGVKVLVLLRMHVCEPFSRMFICLSSLCKGRSCCSEEETESQSLPNILWMRHGAEPEQSQSKAP